MKDVCWKCSGTVNAKDKVCPHCGARVKQTQQVLTPASSRKEKHDEPYLLLWAFAGFISPVVGLILHLIFKDKRPRSASNALKGSLVSILISVIVFVVVFVAMVLQPGASSYNL